MVRTPKFLFTLCLSLLLLLPARSQFGLPPTGVAEVEEGDAPQILSEEDAANIAELIKKAKTDPQTQELLVRLKDDMNTEIQELRKLPQEEILGALKLTYEEITMLDYLFQDPNRALVEMEKEGMIDPKRVAEYKKDPALLEKDTKRAHYFQFVSLAVVGGFM
uniref:Uncharacterized protein n=1 Tax=Corethron hystrix TaxID=216773 RepID=A0A7S1C1S6_9STRA|mmetsp:Transcript_8321/g.18156  ORF Transcript_8321/g.18156 Transcript_8321/m.18156 type:complete len:163 (+) Transcript_8321:83-571(+)